MTELRLTPAVLKILEFIERGGDEGRMELQVTASGGTSHSILQRLRAAGYVERVVQPYVALGRFVDRVRITDAGRSALADLPTKRGGSRE